VRTPERDRFRAFRAAVPFLAAATLLPACTDDSGTGVDPDLVHAAAARWNEKEPASYAYTLRYDCFCAYNLVHVTANRDSVVSAYSIQGKDSSLVTQHPQAFSIDSLFAGLEDLPRGRSSVTFDGTYGFPERVEVEAEKMVVDGGYIRTISDFRPL
jgi:hypothetical protein